MKEKFYKGDIIDLWLEDDILFADYKTREVDLHIAKMATEQRLAYSKDKYYPIFVDYTKVISTTKEARDYFASEQSSKFITAMAILVNSRLGKLIVNFYLNINNPKYPTKIFNDKKEAIAWLKSLNIKIQFQHSNED